jgi:tRNA isopentenyl-2-thiomethyl-A-37 hydroxylase MiaE
MDRRTNRMSAIDSALRCRCQAAAERACEVVTRSVSLARERAATYETLAKQMEQRAAAACRITAVRRAACRSRLAAEYGQTALDDLIFYQKFVRDRSFIGDRGLLAVSTDHAIGGPAPMTLAVIAGVSASEPGGTEVLGVD